MRPEPYSKSRSSLAPGVAQGGFSIVSAIFLIVTLAALGAFMVSFSTTQHATSTQDLQGARAYQAARAGIEFGVYQTLIPGTAPTCGSSATPALGGTLSTFSLTVLFTCSSVYTEGTTTMTVYTITSTATQGTLGMPQYVDRQLQATVIR
jgi:MSHA biogenesis protein MshP